MAISQRNQRRLRAFLKEVRGRHGLSQGDFALLIGLKGSMFSAFERGEKGLGYDSMRKIAKALSLGPELVAAIVDPEVRFIRLPSPESVRLNEPKTIPDILIDFETASKMRDLVSTAGPLRLSEVIQPFVK